MDKIAESFKIGKKLALRKILPNLTRNQKLLIKGLGGLGALGLGASAIESKFLAKELLGEAAESAVQTTIPEITKSIPKEVVEAALTKVPQKATGLIPSLDTMLAKARPIMDDVNQAGRQVSFKFQELGDIIKRFEDQAERYRERLTKSDNFLRSNILGLGEEQLANSKYFTTRNVIDSLKENFPQLQPRVLTESHAYQYSPELAAAIEKAAKNPYHDTRINKAVLENIENSLRKLRSIEGQSQIDKLISDYKYRNVIPNKELAAIKKDRVERIALGLAGRFKGTKAYTPYGKYQKLDKITKLYEDALGEYNKAIQNNTILGGHRGYTMEQMLREGLEDKPFYKYDRSAIDKELLEIAPKLEKELYREGRDRLKTVHDYLTSREGRRSPLESLRRYAPMTGADAPNPSLKYNSKTEAQELYRQAFSKDEAPAQILRDSWYSIKAEQDRMKFLKKLRKDHQASFADKTLHNVKNFFK